MSPLIEDRLEALTRIPLTFGSHPSFEAGVCAMEMVAYLAGEAHSATPACTCRVLAAFVVALSDGLPTDADRDRLLKPVLPRLIGTRANADVEARRAFLAMDWAIRTSTPAWLDLIDDLTPHAAALRALDAIRDLSTLAAAAPVLRSAADAAQKSASAARDAARDAAVGAARAAAGAVGAARAAPRAAAVDAARAAGWNAAGAASWSASVDAAGAGDALAPTVRVLQTSAIDLLERMVAAGAADGGPA